MTVWVYRRYFRHATGSRRDRFGMFHMRPALSHSSIVDASGREGWCARSLHHLSLLWENVGVTLVKDGHGGAAGIEISIVSEIWWWLKDWTHRKSLPQAVPSSIYSLKLQVRKQALQNPFCRKVIPSPSKIRSPRATRHILFPMYGKRAWSSTLLWATEFASEVRYTVRAVYLGFF